MKLALSGPGNRACCPGIAQIFPGPGVWLQWGLENDLVFLYLYTAGFACENPLSPHAAVVVEASGEDISIETQALALLYGTAVLGPHPAFAVCRVGFRNRIRAKSLGDPPFPADGYGFVPVGQHACVCAAGVFPEGKLGNVRVCGDFCHCPKRH